MGITACAKATSGVTVAMSIPDTCFSCIGSATWEDRRQSARWGALSYGQSGAPSPAASTSGSATTDKVGDRSRLPRLPPGIVPVTQGVSFTVGVRGSERQPIGDPLAVRREAEALVESKCAGRVVGLPLVAQHIGCDRLPLQHEVRRPTAERTGTGDLDRWGSSAAPHPSTCRTGPPLQVIELLNQRR